MKRTYIYAVTLLFLSGCTTQTQNETDDVPIIHIESKQLLKNVKLSELIEDVRFVPLETADKCLIGQLDKIEFSNGDIIALDSRKARAIYRFSKDGAFLNTIAQLGQGPGEYQSLQDISVNPNNTEEIAILARLKKLLIYKSDNTFLREIPLQAYAYKVGWYDHCIALYSERNEDLMLIDDKDGREIGTFFDTDIATKLVLPYPFQLYQNKALLYLTNLDYTIYKISEDKVSPHVRFTFDKPMYSDKDLILIKEDINNTDKFFSIRYYNENSSHICVMYVYERSVYMVVHDKSNSKMTAFALGDIHNDVFFTKFMPVVMAVDPDGYFVAQFDYSQVSNPDELKKRLGDSAKNLDEMSNPILVFFKFK